MSSLSKKLLAPFPASDIEWRVQSANKDGTSAMVLAYVTARAIYDRLDDAVGPERWCNVLEKGPDGGVMAGISIKMDDGCWVTKFDGAENTDVEAVKGGISGAMKRAAVLWGIGRYLYNLDTSWVKLEDKGGRGMVYAGKGKHFAVPKLPNWALPSKASEKPQEALREPAAATTPLPEENAPESTTDVLTVDPEVMSKLKEAFAEWQVFPKDLRELSGKPLDAWVAADLEFMKSLYKKWNKMNPLDRKQAIYEAISGNAL